MEVWQHHSKEIPMKIIVESEEEKKQLIEASRHIHGLRDLDTNIPMANFIAHLYMAPHLIEIQTPD